MIVAVPLTFNEDRVVDPAVTVDNVLFPDTLIVAVDICAELVMLLDVTCVNADVPDTLRDVPEIPDNVLSPDTPRVPVIPVLPSVVGPEVNDPELKMTEVVNCPIDVVPSDVFPETVNPPDINNEDRVVLPA